MAEWAGWIAPVATMIAAMMTAANLGARVTGWGFVVFAVGSVAWIIVAAASDQPNLLWTNIFLALVNVVGIWRWLGRVARYEEGGRAAAERSAESDSPSLFALSTLEGREVKAPDGGVIAHAVDAMAHRRDGRISYIVVREGGVAGVGERLHALAWVDIGMTDEAIATRLSGETLVAREPIAPEHWPARAPGG